MLRPFGDARAEIAEDEGVAIAIVLEEHVTPARMLACAIDKLREVTPTEAALPVLDNIVEGIAITQYRQLDGLCEHGTRGVDLGFFHQGKNTCDGGFVVAHKLVVPALPKIIEEHT